MRAAFAIFVLFAVLASTHALKKAPVIGNSTAQIVLEPEKGGYSWKDLIKTQIHEECIKHCTPPGEEDSDVEKYDSHCVSECEVELFRCHDHNHTTTIGWPPHKACTDAAIKELGSLGNPIGPGTLASPVEAPAGAPSP